MRHAKWAYWALMDPDKYFKRHCASASQEHLPLQQPRASTFNALGESNLKQQKTIRAAFALNFVTAMAQHYTWIVCMWYFI